MYNKKVVNGSNCSDANNGDRYGSITCHEEVMIISVQWMEDGRRLAGDELKWQWR